MQCCGAERKAPGDKRKTKQIKIKKKTAMQLQAVICGAERTAPSVEEKILDLEWGVQSVW